MTSYISYGIDLGTTNSCIAKFDGEQVRIFQNNDQMSVTPSVVRIEKSGRIIVGRRAYASKLANPTNVASEFKRWMGQKDRYTFQASSKELSAEELSAEVLRALLEDVRSQTGESVEAAVITVPAAFGQLQCEATARAARLAGLRDSVLLQEPIAAAIAYGIAPTSKDQRWIVFDLGGGTFDVAVMSSRDGRLTVLEHRGDNHLGGKDIDRLLVEKLLIPALEDGFDLPTKTEAPDIHQSLMQRLFLKAEEAKIDLTRNEKVIVSLFDLGQDKSGNEIEGEIEISRHQLEGICAPILEKCISLCEEALVGARADKASLDCILLVGGPTQMPIVREQLERRLETKLEYSLDPMTIVAQGAAIHAASIEKVSASTQVQSLDNNSVDLTIAYDSVSSTLQCPVDGRIDNESINKNISLKIDAESGHWTSGWITPKDGIFETLVSLLEGKSCKFWIYARDEQGKSLITYPDSFTIRHGLSLSAPPLPHTISIELVKPDGSTELEPMFKRGTSLPNEVTKTFRANKTLRPSEEDSIAIKLWEGEAFADPEANEFAGTLLIESNKLQRPLAEGCEIEVTVTIDSSRCMNVTAFVAKLNAHFTEEVYAPQRDEKQYAQLAEDIPKQLQTNFDRLSKLEDSVSTTDTDAVKQVQKLREQLEELDLEVDSQNSTSTDLDPDRAKRLVEETKNIRANLAKIETKVCGQTNNTAQLNDIEETKSLTESLIEDHGLPSDKRELTVLERELERALDKNDERGLRRVAEGFDSLYYRILFKQDWYWGEMFKHLANSKRPFSNDTLAKQLLSDGASALRQGDATQLRDIVSKLWKLLPKDQVQMDREKVLSTGLRK